MDDACGSCPACSRIVRGAHGDVQIIEPGETGSIKIEQVRAAIDRAVYRPFEGRRRVTIIDQADALVPAAQNALLKTLEEPLPASVFILVTSRPDMLLATVRSRCAQLRFGRLNVADVAVVLERGHGYSHAEALTAAAASDGSVQRALELQAEDFADARGDAEALLAVAGRDPRTRLDSCEGSVERRRLGRVRARAPGSQASGAVVVVAGCWPVDEWRRCAAPCQSRSPRRTGCIGAHSGLRAHRANIRDSRPCARCPRAKRESEGCC